MEDMKSVIGSASADGPALHAKLACESSVNWLQRGDAKAGGDGGRRRLFA